MRFGIEVTESEAREWKLDECNGGWLAWWWRGDVVFEIGVGWCGDWREESGSRESWPGIFWFAVVVVE